MILEDTYEKGLTNAVVDASGILSDKMESGIKMSGYELDC